MTDTMNVGTPKNPNVLTNRAGDGNFIAVKILSTPSPTSKPIKECDYSNAHKFLYSQFLGILVP